MGTLPRPFLWADPSPVVHKEANVTLRCQGRPGSDRFQLWMDGELREERNDSWSQADFVLRRVDDFNDARSYRCRSGQGTLWSELSDPLALVVVTELLPRPSISVSPRSIISASTTVNICCSFQSLSSSQSYSFALLEAKSLEPLQLQNITGKQAAFSLPSVRTEDSGSYSCIYYRKTPPYRGSYPSHALELTVLGPLPKPTLWTHTDLVVTPRTNIILWCSRPRLSSLQEVTFTLWKSGTQEPLQQQPTADLWTDFSLSSLSPEDTGSYRCAYRTVSGTESESSDAVELVVPGSLPKPSLSALPGLVVEPGKHVTLQCRQPPRSALWRATFTLLKVGSPQPLQSQSPAGTSADFPLLSVRAQDVGNYTCVYYSRTSPYQVSEPSDALELTVLGPLAKPTLWTHTDLVVTPRTNIILWCSRPRLSSLQEVTFTLWKSGTQEPLQQQPTEDLWTDFSLSSLSPEDTGSYRCAYRTVSGTESESSHALELTVLGPLAKPTLWTHADLVVTPRTNITLWCSRPRLYSLQEVTFTLLKSGTQKPLQQQPTEDLWTDFSLSSVRPEDTGSYRCAYRTVSGTASSDALELVVPGSLPKPSLSALPGLVVEPGKHVTLQCRQPPRSALWRATFTLLKVGSPQPLQSQSPAGTSADFPLLSVRAQDVGNYTCVYYSRTSPYQVSEPSDALEIWVTDELPKPSLSASPGLEVVSGTNVTFLCWGPSWATKFVLYKEGVEEILHNKGAHEDRGQFLLTRVTPKDSGKYSCSYHLGINESLWKQPSDALELLVKDSSNNLIILLSCVSFLLLLCLLLFAFLRHGSIPMGSLQGYSPQSCFCCSCLPWRTCLPHHPEAPREESPYTEVAVDRPRELQVSIAEEPQGVTYTQLNIKTLNKKKTNSKKSPTEDTLYASLYLD
ncbi:immunoglobulin superfamily member 1-like [Antechinus flavipes]|uniref:immunoglobulin superfamily member 1-like n=1 Tax=Antechinus flavipes TaxID=38775 RepID=UPI0022366644|nr:immunoglobulin superfamily member 1-like [Antechinus flavipes]